jgi:hypothetical protein
MQDRRRTAIRPDLQLRSSEGVYHQPVSNPLDDAVQELADRLNDPDEPKPVGPARVWDVPRDKASATDDSITHWTE